jgi:hypothetical protein
MAIVLCFNLGGELSKVKPFTSLKASATPVSWTRDLQTILMFFLMKYGKHFTLLGISQ